MAERRPGIDASRNQPPVPVEPSLASLQAYYERLMNALDLPLTGYYRSGDETFFVVLQRLYSPDTDTDLSQGLMCDVRQENRPMLVPLAQVEVSGDEAAAAVIAEYAAWLRRTQSTLPISHGSSDA